MKRMMYLDKKSKEIEYLLSGTKDVILRGANIKKYPFEMIHKDDRLYLLLNDAKDIVYSSARVKDALFFEISNKDQMTKLIEKYQDRAKLSKQRLDYIKARKYVSVFVLDDVKREKARIDHSLSHQIEDWIILNDIDE